MSLYDLKNDKNKLAVIEYVDHVIEFYRGLPDADKYVEAYSKLKDTSDLYNFPKYYSNKGDVLHYLGRILPLTYLFLNKNTSPNQPHSIMASLFQTFRNSTTSKEEIKEIAQAILG